MTPTPRKPSLEMASVLFMDVIGFARNTLEKQRELLNLLQEIVRGTNEYCAAEKEGTLLKLPTGDGMALVFGHDPVAPVRCAIEIQNALRSHPSGLVLRTGIHTGPIFRHSDIKDNINVVGGGINMAQRVMDFGDAGHILVSRAVAEVLEQLDDWPPCIKELGSFEIKHGSKLQIYNVLRDGAGNAAFPAKLKALEKVAPPAARSLWPIWAAAAVLLLGGAAWFGLRPSPAPPEAKVVPPVEIPQHIVRYYFIRQKFRNKAPFEEPSQLDGDHVFDSGDGIKIAVSAQEPGHLYLLNEGPGSTPDEPDLNTFFPSPLVQQGSSSLEKDQEIRIPPKSEKYLLFDKAKGTENFWVVWSRNPVAELEGLAKWANMKTAGGAVKDQAQAKQAYAFLRKYPEEKPPENDAVHNLTTLRGTGDILVHLIKLRHD